MDFIEISGGDTTKLKPDSVLCSAHFENDCFLQYVRSRALKDTAVPTILINRKIYVINIYIFII